MERRFLLANSILGKAVLAATMLAALTATATPTLAQDKRVALVVGNAAYKHTQALANPANDARDLAAALGRLGFQVTERTDLGRLELERAIRDFGRAADGARAALFFYAGHALQVNGRNYLMPVDAQLKEERDLPYEAIDVTLALSEMERENRVNLVILDSCRDNPLAAKLAASGGAGRSLAVGRGLARVDAAVGTLVAFATRDGAVAADGAGKNSPYTAALLRHIEQPGLKVEDLFKRVRESVMAATNRAQVPYEYGALVGDFYFKPGEAGAQAPAPVAPPQVASLPSRPDYALDVIDKSYTAKATARVREAPDVQAKVVATLKEGETIHVLGRLKGQDWYQVERKGQPPGFVAHSLLTDAIERPKPVPPAPAPQQAARVTAPEPPAVAGPAGYVLAIGEFKLQDGKKSDVGRQLMLAEASKTKTKLTVTALVPERVKYDFVLTGLQESAEGTNVTAKPGYVRKGFKYVEQGGNYIELVVRVQIQLMRVTDGAVLTETSEIKDKVAGGVEQANAQATVMARKGIAESVKKLMESVNAGASSFIETAAVRK